MPADSSKWTYRVVGIRHDQTRANLGDGLTKDRALAVVDALVDTGAFLQIVVEPEFEPPKAN
jgi:hypothetical protein